MLEVDAGLVAVEPVTRLGFEIGQRRSGAVGLAGGQRLAAARTPHHPGRAAGRPAKLRGLLDDQHVQAGH